MKVKVKVSNSLWPHVLYRTRVSCVSCIPCGSDVKESACSAGDPVSTPEPGRYPGRGHRQPTPVFSPGEFHGQVAGYSPQGHKELDTTERLTHTQTLKLEQALFFFPQNNCFLCPLMNLSLETPTSQMTSFLLFLGLCPTSLPWERKKGNSSSPTKAGGDGGRHLHPTLQGQKTASLALWLPLLLSKGPVG